MYPIVSNMIQNMINHARNEAGAILRIHNILEVWDRKAKLNDIRKKLIPRIRQIKQIWGMFRGKP